MDMRIDKLLSTMGLASRSESSKAARAGLIKVNGVTVKTAEVKADPSKDLIEYMGRQVIYEEYVYIMMNKPSGVVSSTDGKDGDTVISLLPEELQKRGLFPCGRLDKDTVGLLIITNDGSTSHYLLSPKRHVSKIYRVQTQYPVTQKDIEELEKGISLDKGDTARPAKVERIAENELFITITEGMYHQIKRMLEAVNNKVVFLERVEFGTIQLDTSLQRGKWRFLTKQEINTLLELTK